MGNLRRALEYQEQALAIRREVLGEKHPAILTLVLVVASGWAGLGNWPRSIKVINEGLHYAIRPSRVRSTLN